MIAAIVSVTRVSGTVTAAVRLNEGDGRGVVEYVATVRAVDPAGNELDAQEIKAALIAEWQRLRSLRPTPPVDLTGAVNGTVNL